MKPRKHVGEHEPGRDLAQYDRGQQHQVALAYHDYGDLSRGAMGRPTPLNVRGRVMAREGDQAGGNLGCLLQRLGNSDVVNLDDKGPGRQVPLAGEMATIVNRRKRLG